MATGVSKTTRQKPASSENAAGWTAAGFIESLQAVSNRKELENVQRFFNEKETSKFLGVRMAYIFKLAKEAQSMNLGEVSKLLKSEYYEARMGAVSILDFKARDKKITPQTRMELFELYINNHDRINNWDMVDRSAPWVVGGYLADKSRSALYKLAKSKKCLGNKNGNSQHLVFYQAG